MTVYTRPGTAGSLMSYESRYGNHIGGEWVPPVEGLYFDNPTPVTGQTFCEATRSDEADIESIAGDATRGTRHHREGRKSRLVLVMAPQSGQYDIGQQQVGDEHAHQNDPPPSPTCNLRHALPPSN